MSPKIKKILLILLAITAVFFIYCINLNAQLLKIYQDKQSSVIFDRNQKVILIKPNTNGYYALYANSAPENFTKLLIAKEDKYFYFHKGFNPVSTLQAIGAKIGLANRQGSSTLTQQLAKILLSQENSRSAQNKITEFFYALSLELFNSKQDILTMYCNSIYLGNQLQGLTSASQAYFSASPENLTNAQISQLLATINSPTQNNPATNNNIAKAQLTQQAININDSNFASSSDVLNNLKIFSQTNLPILELQKYLTDIKTNQTLTIDSELNQKTREIVDRNMSLLKTKKAKNAAAVILYLPNNEILSLVGSPDPFSYAQGYQINMIDKPRQIGSTIKPFIYLKAFSKGMRPYTLIDDREYKYESAGNYALYPRNYDYKYHGEMTAHFALSNSINVPAVKTLEFVGLDEFGNFLTKDLEFKPYQSIEKYQMGIALGAFEMSLMDLSHYFTIFGNQGNLKNLTLFKDGKTNSQFFKYQNKKVVDKEFVELINKILNDRKTGVDQFGAGSSLNLPADNYALKTGTSHDYTDSWIVGYTPDFLVGVWVGNADNSATEGISGQLGAGLLWGELMNLMLTSEYNHKTELNFADIKEYQGKNGIEFGLANDDFAKAQNLIKDQDKALILHPHNLDVFVFQKDARITLSAKQEVKWQINGQDFAFGNDLVFTPQKEGRYQITALLGNQSETIGIDFIKQ